MRRAAVAVLCALVVLVCPASAQLAPADQTILDAIIMLEPPDRAGLCMQIGAGTLTVTAQVTSGSFATPSPQPAFDLNGFMTDPDVHVMMRVTANEASSTVQLVGTRYCWSLGIDSRALP